MPRAVVFETWEAGKYQPDPRPQEGWALGVEPLPRGGAAMASVGELSPRINCAGVISSSSIALGAAHRGGAV